MFTGAEIQTVIDEVFARAEAVSPGWTAWAEKIANTVIDNSPLPDLIAAKLNALLLKKMQVLMAAAKA